MISKIKKELMKTLAILKHESFEGEVIYSPEELNISERAVGGKVELINQDGTLSELPDGDYEVSDGFKFTIKDGLIASIDGETPAEDTTDKPEEMAEAPVDAPTQDAPQTDGLDELKKETASLKAEVEALKQAMDELMKATAGRASKEDVSKFQAEVENLNSNIMKLAKIPAEPTKTNTSNVVKDKNDENLMEFAKIFKSINKK